MVERSRAWHDAVARSRYQMVDVHQLEWFVRPREQVLIQTFHGYPYKVMGHDWWEKMGNSVQEIGSLDRRTRDWSALVSPAPYATPLLRAAFLEPAGAGDVPVLEIGYPRNDALVRPEAARTRTRARAAARARRRRRRGALRADLPRLPLAGGPHGAHRQLLRRRRGAVGCCRRTTCS